ncbi:hypothetical protein [Psychromicrobium sp. YIM B11713]|uniref:hypothetical protein n=1 Tax=Psychromicrobium sp. YIM B11713 TaxID=3145233 RepID=UPI00374E5F09
MRIKAEFFRIAAMAVFIVSIIFLFLGMVALNNSILEIGIGMVFIGIILLGIFFLLKIRTRRGVDR